jgi:alginate O-acetyltransferase complex protein AlgI
MTFICWGLYHGALLAAERFARGRWGIAPVGPAGVLLTFVLVTLGWVIFRADSLAHALVYYSAMLGLQGAGPIYYTLAHFLTPDRVAFIATGALFAWLPVERLRWAASPAAQAGLRGAAALAVFGYAVAMLAANSFSPFIYFRF